MAVVDKKSIRLILFCLASFSLQAQLSMDYGQLPPDTEWFKMASPRFSLYYPEGMEGPARQTAVFLDRNLGRIGASLGSSPRPFPLLLNNKYGLINGMVTFLPFRSEWYHTAPQSSFTHNENWFHVLGIHETRHVAQFDRMNTGAVRAAWYLSGEPGQALLSGMAFPAWFFEGDAVLTETLLSDGGRGRTPSFQKTLRAQAQADTLFSYQKQFLGSYRDYTGNYYDMGYFMIAWLRKNTDAQTFENLMDQASRWAFWPWSFNKALKKELSLSLTDLYEEVFNEAAGAWEERAPEVFSDSLFPGQDAAENSSYVLAGTWRNGLIALCRRPDRPGSLVYLKDGREVFLTRATPESNITLSGDSLVWCEYRRNHRWGKILYSVPVVYNLETGKKHDLVTGDWLYYPSFSPDGRFLVFVRIDGSSRHSLVVFNREEGVSEIELGFDYGTEIQNPYWSEEGIVFIHKKDRRGQIRLWNPLSDRSEVLKDYHREVLLRPSFHKGSLFYISSESGIMNLYEENVDTGLVQSVSSVPFDLSSYVIENQNLYYTSWTQRGSKVYTRENFSRVRPALPDRQSAFWAAFDDLAGLEEKADYSVPSDQAIPSHRVFWHDDLLSWNSWGPWMEDPDNIGLYGESRNLMNTLLLHANGQINYEGGGPGAVISLDFARYYPVISLRLSSLQQTVDSEETYFYRASWASLGLTVPYIRDRGDYVQVFTASLSGKIEYLSDFRNTALTNQYQVPLSAGLGVEINGPTALQDMESVRSANFYSWYDYLMDDEDNSSLVSLLSRVSVPLGNLPLSVETEGKAEYALRGASGISSRVSPVHGLSFPGDQVRIFGRAKLGLPPVFPDSPLFSLYYLKAVWCNIFAETAFSSDGLREEWNHNEAYGAEFWVRQMFFNLPVPVDLGAVIVYKPESSWGRKAGTAFYAEIRLPL